MLTICTLKPVESLGIWKCLFCLFVFKPQIKKKKDSGCGSRVDSNTKMKQKQINPERAASQKPQHNEMSCKLFQKTSGRKKKMCVFKNGIFQELFNNSFME